MNPRPLLALPSLALVCALASNALAPPRRHLAWLGRPLEVADLGPAPIQPMVSSVPAPPSPRPTLSPQAPAPEPRRTPVPTPPTVVPTPPSPTASHPLREITGDEAWAHFQTGARMLDARRSADYEAGHIAGAYSLPVWESDLEVRLTTFEADSGAGSRDPLVLYCGGGDCQDSHQLGARLLTLGYRQVLIYKEGFPDWVRAGRPVRKGAQR